MPAKQKYLVQLKLPSWNLYGGYSEGEEIHATNNKEAVEKGQKYFQERKQLKQAEAGFRVLKIVYEENEQK